MTHSLTKGPENCWEPMANENVEASSDARQNGAGSLTLFPKNRTVHGPFARYFPCLVTAGD